MYEAMSNRFKLTDLLHRAWCRRYKVTIVPEMTKLSVVLDVDDRRIIEHMMPDVPSEAAIIAAIVEGLERAFEETDRE